MERICIYWPNKEEHLGWMIERFFFALFEDGELIYLDNSSGLETMSQLQSLLKTSFVSWLCPKRGESLEKAPFNLIRRDDISCQSPLLRKLESELKKDQTVEVSYFLQADSGNFFNLETWIRANSEEASSHKAGGRVYESLDELVVDTLLDHRIGKIRHLLSYVEREANEKVETISFAHDESSAVDLYYSYLKILDR